MAVEIDHQGLFQSLKAILRKYEAELEVREISPMRYELHSPVLGESGKPIYVSGLMIFKGHVGFYSMPVFTNPALLDDFSEERRNCLNGKSCFHIKKYDAKLFEEIADLAAAGIEDYRKRGWI